MAIKVLPAELASDPDRRERFEREAKAIAALNHPNICTLFDVGHEDGTDFLVMEHLEGESLQDRLTKGAVPLDQALQIAIQIADALDKAHRQGITHRDLKPGNIFLTKKRGAKLLDFGLAKLTDSRSARLQPSEEDSTKLADNLTAEGSILGTFHYMAPEQLEGQEADSRSDIWAFGCVVYEMVTGQKAFEGESQASLITSIMSSEPPALSAMQALSPLALDRTVIKCLKKDRDDRWQTAKDLGDELTWVARETVSPAHASTAPSSDRSALSRVVLAGCVVVFMVALAVWGGMRLGRTNPGVTRFTITTPSTARGVAISQDGRTVVYAAAGQLFRYSLDGFESAMLADGEEATGPFISHDGGQVGFTDGSGTSLSTVALAGGPARTVLNASVTGSPTWMPDGSILVGRRNSGLMRVDPESGEVEQVTTLDAASGEEFHDEPHVLPGGAHLVFSVRTPDGPQLDVLDLETGGRHRIGQGRVPVYAPTGHLLFVRGENLWAVRFDVDALVPVGEPLSVLEGVGPGGYTLSETGTLAFTPPRELGAPSSTQYVWVTRSGEEEPLLLPPGTYAYARVSPEGDRVVLTQTTGGDVGDIVVWDLARESLLRLTFDEASDHYPQWTPDGARVVFHSGRDEGPSNLYWKAADGLGDAEAPAHE